MPLAPLQALAAVLAVGAAACLLAVCLTGRSRHRLLLSGAVAVAGALVLAALYVAFATAVTTWDERPELAQGGALVLVAALMVLSLAYRAAHERRARHHDGDEHDDDGGGDGGQRRPTVTPPRRPPPAGPSPPSAPWDEFDAIRSGWDRVPAGRR